MLNSSAKNYDRLLEKELDSFGGRPKILLHSCCAPCSSYVIEYLRDRCELVVFYFNPNISPEDEYIKRLGEQKRFINKLGGIEIIEGDYREGAGAFILAVKGLESESEGGKRCSLCFKLRLTETAKMAKKIGADYFATTLTVSPHKNAEIINNISVDIENEIGVRALLSDFKKRGGYQRSLVLSKEHKLYRQNYCGCIFSKNI